MDRLKVLLIEDDEEDYLLVKEFLSAAPVTRFNLDWVKSYDAGLEAVCRLDYDAYLLDYLLDDRTGLDLLSEANSRGCLVPVILLTGRGTSSIDIEAITAGAADYLVKSEINPDILDRSIRYAVERKKSETELTRYRNHLEELVQQRTTQLQEANLRLEKEIEDRERADLALRQSERQYRMLVDSSLDLIFTISSEGIILSLNPAFEKITGWRAEEWIGKKCSSLVHPDDVVLMSERVCRSIHGDNLPPVEIRVRTKSGGLRVLEFRSAPLHGTTVTGTARDVTHRKQTEARLIDQNKFLNNVLESLSHPFYVVNADDYSLALANSAASPETLPPDSKCYSLFHRTDQACAGAEHKCPLQEIKRSKKPIVTEHVHYDHLGRPRYVEIHGYPIFNESGEVSQIIEYCLDITDRKEMEENLRRAHDELELRVQHRTAELASANTALMNEITERKRIEEALRLDERRLEALLELDQIPWASEREIATYVLDQLIRLTRSEIGTLGFLDEEEKILALQAWSAEVMPQCESCADSPHFLIESGGLWADSIRKREPVIVNDYSISHDEKQGLPIGHIPLRRFTSIPVYDGERIVALAIVANKKEEYDQSDVRQVTLLMDGMWKLIQRENSTKALKEAENLAAIGKALAGVAHDMKVPLVAIGGFTKLVHRHLGKGHPDSDKMQLVLNETRRLEKLVEDMLDFSKPLDLEKSFEEIGPIIDDSLAIVKSIAEKHGVSLKVESLHPVPAVPLDRSRMKQVFINLFTNAIQASPAATTVTIRYRTRGTHLILDVADCGCGIPPEKRRDIFVPFFTTKKEGTGLGLPIVGKVIEAHKGHIDVLSNVCGGITFRILLPLS